MNNIFIHYPKCTTCQRAKKFLDDNNIKYTERHIVTETPTYEELKNIIEDSGFPVSKFFNTSGLLYKSMELKTKLTSMTEKEMLKLLSTDGMLVKRPILVGSDFILVGFKESEWEEKINLKLS
jgi:arsenate reductase